MSWRQYINNEEDEDDEDEEIPAIIIDNGTSSIKAGFANEDPHLIFPSVVGKPTSSKSHMKTRDLKDHYIGDWAHRLRDICSLSYPMEHGIITDWDVMEQIWQYVFTELPAIPEDHPLLITEVPLNPASHREMMAQLLFEGFGIPFLNISIPALLTIYSAGGRTTGVSVDCGAGVTHIVPIYEGHAIRSAITRLNIGGRDVTELLMTSLGEKEGYSFCTSSDRETVRGIKEQCCYVPSGRIKSSTSKKYLLRGKTDISLGKDSLETPEVLFQPSKYGTEDVGIHEAINECITDCDIDLRKDLWGNIILSGGSTYLNGFTERVEVEMVKLAPQGIRTRVVAPPERKYSPYLGGAIISGLSTFAGEMLISRQEYDEYGPSVVSRML